MRVDGSKRTLILPALVEYSPSGASFADGVLDVTFDGPPARA